MPVNGKLAIGWKKYSRRSVNEDRDYDPDELEFLRAIDRYKRKWNRPFPTWQEVLHVVKELGYHK